MATLPARAAEALQQERFKDAVELFKQLVRQDPRPDWTEALADAYAGRARTLAAKGMFKEAAMVLENTLTQAGTVREPRLYATCLIREGQQPKAAAYLLHCVASGALPAGEQGAALQELTAALLVTVPLLPAPARPDPPEAARWRELAAASREALAAWSDGASVEEIECHLNRISLRSAFRPIRLLLKSLVTLPPDPERTRRMLETIEPGSPFHPFRQAVEAAVRTGPELDADVWRRLTPTQQAFAAETGGVPAASVQSLDRLSRVARGGPAALFAWLLKQADLPQAEVKSACLNLLPQLPDRMAQFEKSFGPLPPLQRHRVQALAAEGRGDWWSAERSWSHAARLAGTADDRTSRLSSGVIYRHLAHLAAMHPEIEGGDDEGDPELFYLERSSEIDPEHVPSVLERIARYRQEARDKDWHRLADEAAQRFPDDRRILLEATQSAVARRAYKKAAGLARRLLRIDPINPGVRRQLIELNLAHARKQMRAKRPDLAAKELSQAAEWDRPDAPDGLLRIARGLVALQDGETGQADAWLREGVALAGGGVGGWFRAVIEAELMRCADDAPWLREALAGACRTPPTKEPVLAVASALGQVEAGETRRAVPGLLLQLRAWLLQGAGIAWSPAEFQILADMFVRGDAYELLETYARAARRREPANPEWRFHEIVGRTRGHGHAMSAAEAEELDDMAEAASERQDFHAVTRIARFLGMEQPRSSRTARMADELADGIDDAQLLELLQMVLKDMPKGASDTLRGRAGEVGRKAAVEETMHGLRSSELGAILPEPMLRQLCEDMVARATGGPTARKDRS
jgi:tetratricopeptide (TPR) repeat protein